MKICTRGLYVLTAVLCGMLMSISLSAQIYHRYVRPEDLGTKILYADSVMTSFTLPRGVASVSGNPKFNIAAMELAYVLNDPAKEIMQIYVCGSASPDGLWADNVRLSQSRTDAAAEYLTEVLDVPAYMIYKQSLNEDWDRLYELVAESDMAYKYNVMTIIKSMDWGDRKKALQTLDGGRAWKILEKDFFPKLRCVRIAVFCKWDPSKPYMSVPADESFRNFRESSVTKAKPDTVYIRDTVYYVKETVMMPVEEPQVKVNPVAAHESAYEEYRRNSLEDMQNTGKERKIHDTPWMMGVKTNLIADAMAVPYMGAEVQLAKRMSLDLQGWYTRTNVFVPSDDNANFYGFAPELRLWLSDNTMRKGGFVGLHGSCAWYTMQWRDGYLYQNGPENVWEGNYHNAGNSHPAWSAGVTYGYSLGLGRKAHWGLEFLIGIGYASYSQNTAVYSNEIWEYVGHRNDHHFGITKLGVNLTYRFSLRKVDPDYYDN